MKIKIKLINSGKKWGKVNPNEKGNTKSIQKI